MATGTVTTRDAVDPILLIRVHAVQYHTRVLWIVFGGVWTWTSMNDAFSDFRVPSSPFLLSPCPLIPNRNPQSWLDGRRTVLTTTTLWRCEHASPCFGNASPDASSSKRSTVRAHSASLGEGRRRMEERRWGPRGTSRRSARILLASSCRQWVRIVCGGGSRARVRCGAVIRCGRWRRRRRRCCA